ncbi:MAG: acylneuraminate cytidylyltransferase family protein [Bacteroidota bacterium]
MTTSKALCFIPAKAASTRLIKKNILKLDGKELIYYPIYNGLNAGLFDSYDVILSTESSEIKAIAEQYGARVPRLRPEKLARDPYGVVDVALDFLSAFPKYQTYDSICLLSATAPFTLIEDVVGAYEVYHKSGANVVMSVTPTEHSALRSVYIRKNLVQPVFEEFIFKKSQELEPTYRINGAVIIVRMKAFLEQKTYFMQPWGAYMMPLLRSVDIDNQEGYRYAQFLKTKSKVE